MSNTPSPSGSTQTTATSLNQFSSFSNQPSSRYPIPSNPLPYNSFPPYFLPVQQPVLPPSYPQTYLSSSPYTLQQGNEPTCAHAPSDFPPPPPPPNPVHLIQQYSVLPSHTNTPILHQNPSLSYEQHYSLPSLSSGPSQLQLDHHYHPSNLAHCYRQQPSCTNTAILHQNLSSCAHPPPLSSGPPPQRPRLDSPHLTSFTPTSTAVAHHSLAPPTPATIILSPQFINTTATSQRVSYNTFSPDIQNYLKQRTSHFPLSQHPTLTYTPSLFSTTSEHTQSNSIRHSSNAFYHTEQSSYQQPFPSHHRHSFTSNRDSTITAYYSLAPPLPPATTPSGATASPSTPAHQHPLSPAMQRYVTYLKSVYKTKKTPVYDKEHGLLQVKAKSFINIALVHKHSHAQYMKDSVRNEMIMDRLHGHVDAIQEMKTKLFIHDVCKSQDGGLAHSVLVEGAPGVGKTTFAYELCKRWARGEILQEWPVVVIIKLRDHRTRTAQNMYDLLYHPDHEIQQAVADLIRQDGKGLLMMLDGYDELTVKQREDTSVIQQVMSRELLMCQATIIVTSQPLATRSLHDNFKLSIDQHIEVLGFTEKNIEEYIQSTCEDKPELVKDFKSYLSSHPFSSALMFNPLLCAIVTDLYRSHWESEDKGFAPKTRTELYTGLVHTMLLRYLSQHPAYQHRDWWINDLSDLPEEVNQQLKAITELAAKGIRNQQYVFDEVNTNMPQETLGFLQKEEVVGSGSGVLLAHNFLHITLQEYLAAVNYSQQCSSPEQLSQLLTLDDLFPLDNFLEHYGKKQKTKLYSSATHWPVVLFVAGKTKLCGVPIKIFKAGIHDSDDDDEITTVDVSLLHLLYETQSPQLIQSTLVTSWKYLSVTGISALDWFVIGYCIACSNSVWEVRKEIYVSLKYFEQLFTGLRLGHKQGNSSGNGTIGSVHVGGYWFENLMILSQLQPYTETVRKLKLVEQTHDVMQVGMSTREPKNVTIYPMLEVVTIKNAKVNSFPFILRFISAQKNLRILSMAKCSISTMPLIRYLQSPHCSLHKLELLRCTISNPDDHTQQITTLKNTDLALHSLDISWSVLDQIMPCINPFTKSLTELMVYNDTQHTCSGVKTVLQEIPSNCPLLKTLKFDSYVSISFPLSIFQFIRSQQNNLHTLSLSKCILSSDATRTLIDSLQSPRDCKLCILILCDCIIPTAYHIQLTTAIVSSTTITHLLFFDRNIDTPSLTALASGLKHNTTIEQLAVDKYYHFTKDQFQMLIDIVDSSAVKKLWLHNYSNYRWWFNECTLSRKDVDIVWCSDYHDLYNKW